MRIFSVDSGAVLCQYHTSTKHQLLEVNQMGHSWRDMDPAGAAEHDRRIDRLRNLRKKLENMPLSNFSVGDLGALYRVMGVDTHKDAREKDLARLERKV